MTRSATPATLGLAALLALVALPARAAPKTHAPPPPPHKPSAPLPSLPTVSRVRLDVSREHVVVTEEVLLPRGDWKSGDLDLYVGFGAPGTPEAFDAHLLAVPDGALESRDADAGEPIAIERAPARPSWAQLLLGTPQMAGAILRVPEAAFRRAVAPGGMAALLVRSLLPLPQEDARTGREVLVRLGAALGTPLTLGRLAVTSEDPVTPIARAEAHLCGPEADPWPLAIAIAPRPPVAAPPLDRAPIAPVLAVRHATDDLCVRFWL